MTSKKTPLSVKPTACAAAAKRPTMVAPTVDAIFERLAETFSLRSRASQLSLARDVRTTLATGGVCCIEAPTGTGKTLGYLAGALEYQSHTKNPMPIVVATATVGLQEQIIRHDIPRLVAIGALEPSKVAIAKGRGRYFCPRMAATLEAGKHDAQLDMLNPEKPVVAAGVPVALSMLRAWRDRKWDGDSDSWEEALPECWSTSCAASSDTCINRACEHFERCPYMQSRARLANAHLIIANHDLVLADLAQRREEAASGTLPIKNYALIFDEAHNLPDKAVNTRRADVDLNDPDWLRKLEPFGEAIATMGRVVRSLEKVGGPELFGSAGARLLHLLEDMRRHLQARESKFSADGTWSWGQAEVDTRLASKSLDGAIVAEELLTALTAAAKALAEQAEEESGLKRGYAVRQLADANHYKQKIKSLLMGLMLFSSGDALVRWATLDRAGRIALHSQPLEGREVLDQLLWSAQMPVVLVSATLQIRGSFARFSDKSGLPRHAVTRALPPVFNYERGFLHQPRMACVPGDEGYESEVVLMLEKIYNNDTAPGKLILFTSRETMSRVVASLRPDIRERVKMQGTRPLPELIAEHKAAIDAGQRSILAGLDSMAEGLDLPGAYCGHVIITRLPFAVPGDPVEEARRKSLGAAWFDEAYLADMIITLIQSCGRLIRREEDHGIITILDKRLSTRRYKLQAIDALPGFTRGAKISGYFEMARKMGLDMSHGLPWRAKERPVTKPATKDSHLTLVQS